LQRKNEKDIEAGGEEPNKKNKIKPAIDNEDKARNQHLNNKKG